MRKTKLLIAGIFFAALTLKAAPAQYVVSIGAIISVTGPGSDVGEAQKNSATMIQEMINNRGGIFQTKLELIVYDDETDVNTCILAAEKMLAKENIIAVIGPTTSGNTLAISDMYEKAKIPLLSLAPSDKIVSPGKKWIFKSSPSHRQAVTLLLNYLKSKGIRRVAVISAADGTGRTGRAALLDIIPRLGIKLVADEVFDSAENTVTVLLEKINESDPQAIVCWATTSQTAMVARDRAQLGIKLPLFAGPQVVSKRFIQLAGNAAEGIQIPVERFTVFKQLSDSHPQKDKIRTYVRDYGARFKTDASASGGYALDAINLIMHAIETGRSFAPTDIRDNLENIRGFVGVGGIYDFAPGDHSGTDWRSFVMVRIVRGNYKIVK
ncbi:MAG: ABC transporter substrate-binding protein [Deltaproteobacteria bacterium]|nr:ABC transporter substrate-binding protein [Deltaproteobacteria bacterium]